MTDSSPLADGTVIVPLKAPYHPAGSQLRGCSILFLYLACLGLIFNLLIFAVEGPDQGLMYLMVITGPLLLTWLLLLSVGRIREKRRLRDVSKHIIIRSTEITVPSILEGIEFQRVRWADLREVRVTRDTVGKIYYEFYRAEQSPVIVVDASRLLDPAQLEREIEARARAVVRTFESTRPAPLPPQSQDHGIPPGKRFNVRLPARVRDTAAGCAGLGAALGLLFGLAWMFRNSLERWVNSGLVPVAAVALLLGGFWLGYFLIVRMRTGWIVCADDGLHSNLTRARFPSFLPWGEIRDFTLITRRKSRSGNVSRSRGGNPSQELTVWTSLGSYSLEFRAIPDGSALLSILHERSARKRGASMETVRGDLELLFPDLT